MKASMPLANGAIQTADGQGRRLTLNRVGKGGVEVEDDLCKTVCLVVFTLLVYDEDLNVPFPEGKALRGRRLVLTIAVCQFWESGVCRYGKLACVRVFVLTYTMCCSVTSLTVRCVSRGPALSALYSILGPSPVAVV